MNKEALLQELSVKLTSGEISRADVLSRLDAGAPDTKKSISFSATKTLYTIGAAIVVIGIIFFVWQIWDDLASAGRITITLGLGLVIAGAGSVLLKQKPNDAIGAVFHGIAGLLVPGGALVTLSELHVDPISLWPVTLTFGAIFIFYLLLNLVHKHPVLTLFAIANGTAFIYLLVEALTDGPFYQHDDLYAYLTMIVGLSYLLLGYSFREGWNKSLVAVLYLFGSAAFFGAAFSRVFDSVPWQWFYFALILGGLFLSVYLRSRNILTMSALFLIIHLSYITSEYFADSLGWPISLVVLGFIFIGLGYASISINKKYITAG